MKLKTIQQILNMAKYMFYGLIIQVFLSSFLTPMDSHGQKESIYELKVNLHTKNLTLRDAFDKIEKETGFVFSFFGEVENELDMLLNTKRKYSNAKLSEILEDISLEHKFRFKRVNNTISVRKSISNSRKVEEVLNTDLKQVKIAGKVTASEDGEPLPGVSILIKGTASGTTTDIDGNYSLSVPEGSILQFTYIGFTPQEITVSSQTTINVTMEPDLAQLEEVIVVGYGTQKKQDLTGAIESIGGDDLPQINASNPLEAVRGQIAGVQISPRTGEPGGGLNIRVRGTSSVRAGNDPLIVVDGVPLPGTDASAGAGDRGGNIGTSGARSPLNFINQADIESITVLKDASSTAIYGSRGANGVIIITTKSGKSGEAKFEYNMNVQFSSLRNDIDLLDASSFSRAASEGGFDIDGGSNSYDWQDVLLRNSISTNHSFSATFGSKSSSNRVSIGYQDNQGIVKRTSMERFSMNFDNTTTGLNDRFELKTKVYAARIEDEAQHTTDNANAVDNLISSALTWNPTRSIRDSDGNFTFVSLENLNPEDLLNAYNDNTTTSRVLSSLSPKINITDNLSFTSLVGIDFSSSERGNSFSPGFRILGFDPETNVDSNGRPAGGLAFVGNVIRNNVTFENYFTYNKQFSDNYSLKALAGYSYYSYETQLKNINAINFNPDQTIVIDNLGGADQQLTEVSSSRSKNELQSYYVRLENEIFGNLLVNAAVRIDGSSRFGDNNKYGVFPAVGLGYRFIDDGNGPLNYLKGRLNYGITGNQELPNNAAISVARYNRGVLGAANNPNPNLQWESTTTIGAGIDFELLDNKLFGSIDAYQRTTSDLIFPLDPSANVPSNGALIFTNLDADVINTGLEISLNYQVIEKEDLEFTVGGNIAFVKSTLENLGNEPEAGRLFGPGLSGVLTQVLTDDEQLFTYRLKEWVGFDEAGFSQFRNSDGSIVGLSEAEDILLEGKTPLPRVNAGLNTNLRYKNFQFTTAWYGNFGHYIYNNTANAFFFYGAFAGGANVPESVVSSGQNIGDASTSSNKFLEKGDFFRLGNITLSYNLSLSDKIEGVDNVRIYAGANNILTFTGYSGFDPEVSNLNITNGIPAVGIDYLGYPQSRSFMVGLDVRF